MPASISLPHALARRGQLSQHTVTVATLIGVLGLCLVLIGCNSELASTGSDQTNGSPAIRQSPDEDTRNSEQNDEPQDVGELHDTEFNIGDWKNDKIYDIWEPPDVETSPRSPNDTFSGILNGVWLVLSYDSTTQVFTGTVENLFTGTVVNPLSHTPRGVTVKIHLSNGLVLGPTTPVDLDPGPGQVAEVTLPAGSQPFATWSARLDVDSWSINPP